MSTANIRVDAFQANVRHLAQQEKSKLLAYVDKDSQQAETNQWDFLSSGDMSAKSDDTATSGNETGRTWSRRQAVATPWNDHELVDTHEINMLLVDPNSKINQSLGYSAGRKIDDLIIAAATGNVNVQTRSGGAVTSTPTALPAGRILGTGAEATSFDLVAQVQKSFMLNDIDPSIPKVAVVGPQQVYELLNLTEQTSSNYVHRESLQRLNATGIVPMWMGFTWVVSTRLTSPTAGERYCLFFTAGDALGFHMPQDITAKCAEDPSRQYAWRPYIEFTAGAARLEDARITVLHLADATAT